MSTVQTLSPEERDRLITLAAEVERDNAILERLRAARVHQKELYRELQKPSVTEGQADLGLLLNRVAIDTETSIGELAGRTRTERLVRARWEFFRRAREQGFTWHAIGRAVNRDHSTVLHALRELDRRATA